VDFFTKTYLRVQIISEESELSAKFSEIEHVKIKWDRLNKTAAHL
jgi:hypothetical protein